MTVLGVILGALAACLVAWSAIGLFAWVGRLGLDARPLRVFGSLALLLLAFAVAGAPVPWALPPALLGVGVIWAVVSPRAREQNT